MGWQLSSPGPFLKDIRDLAGIFEMDRDRLGERLCDVAAEEIMRNMIAECDPDGVRWADLSPSYQAWKDTITPGAPMGVLWGIMRTSAEVRGEREIDAGHAEMGYGETQQARTEAIKFQEGGKVTGTGQPPRPFYAFTRGAIVRATQVLDDVFRRLST